jgi:hypothetical protein
MHYRVEYIADGAGNAVEVDADDELTALFLAGVEEAMDVRDAFDVRVINFSSNVS